ncbi:MAG: hypothetical protein ACHP84_04335 [Caulobacterales bacterium]
MNVEIAEERIRLLTDRYTIDRAEGRAWTMRVEAFGTMARMTGLLSRPKDEEFEVVYRERRLQPFWRIASHAVCAYERARDYHIALAPEVQGVSVEGVDRAIVDGKFTLRGLESCREEVRREVFVDALGGGADPGLSRYMQYPGADATAETLAGFAREGTVVVPPQVRASGLVRDAVSDAIGKIEADRVLEETVRLEAVELVYRPVYAFRYRRGGKEAVVEFDALTDEVSVAGTTFEQHLGKILEPKFLLEFGAEAANIVIPGATVAKVLILKGIEMHEKRKAEGG